MHTGLVYYVTIKVTADCKVKLLHEVLYIDIKCNSPVTGWKTSNLDTFYYRHIYIRDSVFHFLESK